MSRAWLLLSGALGAGSLLLFALTAPEDTALGGPPWTLLSAGLAHWNALHLGGNLLGLAVLGWLGQRAGLGPRDALSWALAGPLGHALLALTPQLPAYAGLSGWLHGGVAVAALALGRQGGAPRRIGVAIGVGLALKLLLEQPWGPLLRPDDWWGGASLPLAHLSGALAGLLVAVLLGLSAAGGPRAAPAPPPAPPAP